jgi:hypothetical protein
MLTSHAFFTFSHLSDPAKHREFNEWHQLDHRPENLALPGVAWGERWVRSPDCRLLGEAQDPAFAGVQYCNMYWLRDPIEESRREFSALGDRCVEWGRRPDLAYTERDLIGFFHAVKAYVDPAVLVSPEALPCRPARGVHVRLSRAVGPSAKIDELWAWYDRVRIPDLVASPGVAGACTFASDPATSGSEIRGVAKGLRLHLYYLDGDPLEVAATLTARMAEWELAGRGLETAPMEVPLFEGWFRTIEPWHWDWFDGARQST